MKQIYIVRKDLNMRKGKLCSQCAHGSLNMLLDMMEMASCNIYGDQIYAQTRPLTPQWMEWLKDGSKKKITLSVDSEAEMDTIREKAIALNIPHHQVIDHGLTEFNGVHTKTVLVLGPWDDEILNTITGKLPLL
jgi:PTH2 family peptidyl-tRNA hydrolase